jgi:hypothetical protein
MGVDIQQRTTQYGHRRHHAEIKTRHGHAHGRIMVLLLKPSINGGITIPAFSKSTLSFTDISASRHGVCLDMGYMIYGG